MIDSFVKFLEEMIPRFFKLLQKIAFIMIFMGILGYFITTFRESGLRDIDVSPIPRGAVQR